MPFPLSLLVVKSLIEIDGASSLSFIAGADSVSNGSTKDRRSWLSAIENTFIWDNIQELVRFVSIWAASGRVAVAGMPGAKRAIVLQRRLDETKSKMTSQSLNRCRYECNEKRHSAFCIMSVENCPQCGHSLLAHKMCPPPDLFRDLRRRLDEPDALKLSLPIDTGSVYNYSKKKHTSCIYTI